MARSLTIIGCLLSLAVAAVAVNDDKCNEETAAIMMKYGSDSPCARFLNKTITATSNEDCPNTNMWVDCFALFEDSWTDLLDDCEDQFDNSACLKQYGDDEFERMVKDECARKRRNMVAKYDAGSECKVMLDTAIYAADDNDCPSNTTLMAQCFSKFEDDWTDLVDDCEELFWYSGCTQLTKLGDDEFEKWVKENGATSSSGMAVAVLAAAGAVMVLAL